MIIMNASHTLLSSQAEALRSKGLGYLLEEGHYLKVPEAGWTLEQIKEVVRDVGMPYAHLVVVSPVPALLGWLCSKAQDGSYAVWVFHNDKREAKEVPDGKGGTKLIHTLAKEGWELVRVA